ncbi:MAG: adenosylmethionine decarboxylase [Thermoproteales archaeon]|nr:adenosylmethionine decarboxylase [Thermoproteales archaeon]RLE65729.1 MAG: adenosylmethionine decarboxylase [Thermoprotei archaeon]
MKTGVGLGRHLVVEMYDCDIKVLDSINLIRQALLEAARAANSTVLGDYFHKFYPQGVTGVVVVAESHLSIHTWPEYGFAAVDIFTCGEHTEPWRALEVLKKTLKPRRMMVMEMKRGLYEVISKSEEVSQRDELKSGI